ncbi:MAG TPA: tetratricopeptide repeat protein [Candidatus Methylomirabilis sp.]|nr:tetratricopeptide repeat protein [Candidatus Methylomirabilis sp.]
MGLLSHLFYPWGFLLQILAIVHFFRRRPEGYWFFVILFGGFLGAIVYIIAEMLPDLGLLRGAFQSFGRKSRIQTVETQIIDNPSAANYEELGELYKDQKQFAKARDAFTKAIEARSDSVYTFYYRGQASLGLNDYAAAVPDLERVVASDAKFDYYRAGALLADAYAKTGQLDRAAQLFAQVTQISTTPETLYNYAAFLKLAGRTEEAKEWTQKLLSKKRTLPRYMQRIERPWFRKGHWLLKELTAAAK